MRSRGDHGNFQLSGKGIMTNLLEPRNGDHIRTSRKKKTPGHYGTILRELLPQVGCDNKCYLAHDAVENKIIVVRQEEILEIPSTLAKGMHIPGKPLREHYDLPPEVDLFEYYEDLNKKRQERSAKAKARAKSKITKKKTVKKKTSQKGVKKS
jgi:hypothetical protein